MKRAEKLFLAGIGFFVLNLVFSIALALQVSRHNGLLRDFDRDITDIHTVVDNIDARTSSEELDRIFEQVQEIYQVIVEGE